MKELNRTQKVVLAVMMIVMFGAAGIHAYRDCTEDKESATVLRECGINPSNGHWSR